MEAITDLVSGESAKTLFNEIDSAILEAYKTYRHRNVKSYEAFQAATNALPGGNTRAVLVMNPFPLMIAEGKGSRLIDLDGHELVNFLSEFTAGLFGTSHPVIKEAICSALDKGMNFGGHGVDEARFAELLREFLPNCDRFRFTPSGSEANALAVSAALAHTGRKKVMVFDGGYHAGGLSFSTHSRQFNFPYDFVVAQYNKIEETRALIRQAGETLGVVLCELMLGSGGGIAASPAFVSMLREETEATGALLVFDEIQTSRLGIGGLQARYNSVPDLTTVGKYLAGGMPFGALGGRADIMNRFDWTMANSWAHPGTFNNHRLTMAAGVAALALILQSPILDALNERGELLKSRLNEIGRKAGVGLQVMGLGSFFTVHWSSNIIREVDDVRAVDPRLRELFHLHLIEHGVWAAKRGLMALNTDLTDGDLDLVCKAVDTFIEKYAPILPPFSGVTPRQTLCDLGDFATNRNSH